MSFNHRLIVGLGNPGKSYEETRHNAGFSLLDAFARKHGLRFRRKAEWKGDVAEGNVCNLSVVLLKPRTFMNLSGESVAAAMRYLKLDLAQLLVVVDDVAIPLGHLRMRMDSGTGGHKGLKSIEDHLQTQGYARLRIGVSAPSSFTGGEKGDLADFVLSPFALDEKELLSQVETRAILALEIWLEKGLTHAMDYANHSPPNPSIGEKQ